jgi:hypothetical protein
MEVTVYVDDMYLYPMGEYKRGNRTYKMSHCVADSREELEAMMRKVGVAVKWIQYPGTWKEHFDIAMSMRSAAIAAGAIPVTMKQLVRMSVIRRETGKLGKPEETSEQNEV